MRLTLQPTAKIIFVGNCRCRVWLGTTDKGTEVQALIAMIAIPDEHADQRPQLAAELAEVERSLFEVETPVSPFGGINWLPPGKPKGKAGN